MFRDVYMLNVCFRREIFCENSFTFSSGVWPSFYKCCIWRLFFQYAYHTFIEDVELMFVESKFYPFSKLVYGWITDFDFWFLSFTTVNYFSGQWENLISSRGNRSPLYKVLGSPTDLESLMGWDLYNTCLKKKKEVLKCLSSD